MKGDDKVWLAVELMWTWPVNHRQHWDKCVGEGDTLGAQLNIQVI